MTHLKPILLFRPDHDSEEEMRVASLYMKVVRYRTDIPVNRSLRHQLVIGRYSVLPYYSELDHEIQSKQCELINSYRQHRFIADVCQWAGPHGCLNGLTPDAYTEWGKGRIPEGAYIVKGRTNSRKFNWRNRMFAPTRSDIPEIARSLMDDSLIVDQGIVVRPYVPLKTFGEGLNGLPITNEFRTFWIVPPGQARTPVLLSHGYYWASHPEYMDQAVFTQRMQDVAQQAALLVSEDANFFVLDIAETATGDAIVVEINDGQMSGLGTIDPHILYQQMARHLPGYDSESLDSGNEFTRV